MSYRIEYKGYDIEIVNSQGIGSWASPLTNTPYGFIIWHKRQVIYHYLKMSSSESYVIKDATQYIDRLLLKEKESVL